MRVSNLWESPLYVQRKRGGGGVGAGELLPLLLVVGVALAARLVLLDRVPTNVMPDEADNMSDVYHILAGTGPGPFGLDWTQLPALNAYLMAAFVQIAGLSVVGMRAAVVVTSTLALFPFYLLVRRIASPAPALLSTLMFATGLWYLNFSRTAWANVHVVLFELVAVWLLLKALEQQRLYLYGLAGSAIALTLYGYYAGRAAVAALLLYLPVGLLLHRRNWRTVAGGYALLSVMMFLVFLPQWRTLQENWDYSSRRVQSVSIFNQPEPYLGETDPARLVWMQAERTVRGFLLLDGRLFATPRYAPAGSPPVDYATGVLYLSGLVLGVAVLRRTLIWYLLLAVPLFATQVLSVGTPDPGRAIVVVPVLYLFVALTLSFLWKAASPLRLGPVVVLLAVAISAYNVWWYFDWAQRPETALARQPAVEYAEFGRWQELQKERAARGERGFTVTEWYTIR